MLLIISLCYKNSICNSVNKTHHCPSFSRRSPNPAHRQMNPEEPDLRTVTQKRRPGGALHFKMFPVRTCFAFLWPDESLPGRLRPSYLELHPPFLPPQRAVVGGQREKTQKLCFQQILKRYVPSKSYQTHFLSLMQISNQRKRKCSQTITLIKKTSNLYSQKAEQE